MAKLTNRQIRDLRAIVNQLEWAQGFLHGDHITVARVERHATTNLHFTRTRDDRVLYEIDKEIGSPLCGYEDALKGLLGFIKSNTA